MAYRDERQKSADKHGRTWGLITSYGIIKVSIKINNDLMHSVRSQKKKLVFPKPLQSIIPHLAVAAGKFQSSTSVKLNFYVWPLYDDQWP